MQENQLYIFDPKAMHQIVVKVRFIIFYWLHSRPIFQDQYIYEDTTSSIEYPGFLPSLTLVHWNQFLRGKKVMFGPGLGAILGEYIFSSMLESKECQQYLFLRGAAS